MRRRWTRLGTANQIGVIGLVVATLGLLPAYFALLATEQTPAIPSPSSSKAAVTSKSLDGENLKVVDLVVLNGTDWERSPEIQVTLHNMGAQRSIIKRALFKIQRLESPCRVVTRTR
jgi:hypothetical protein